MSADVNSCKNHPLRDILFPTAEKHRIVSRPKPRILGVTSYDLDGPDNGGTLRNRHVFRYLSRIGEVSIVLAGDFQDTCKNKRTTGGLPLIDVVCFDRTDPWSVNDRLRNEFDATFVNTDRMQARPKDRARLEQQIATHDLVWIHTLRLANRYGRWHWPSTVLDIDDIPSSLYSTHLNAAESVVEKLRDLRQVILWRRREKLLLRRFDAVCVCSNEDRDRLGPGDRIFVLPNGFTRPTHAPARQLASPPRIGFMGNFAHMPNREGISWFVKSVWRLILEQHPDVRLRLAGAGSDDGSWHMVRNADSLGWIADLESEMQTWCLCIVPVRVGGGTRVKIAEAFSRKCPVVSTTLGAYGYDVADRHELLLADSAETFAAKCLGVLNAPAEAEAMAERAWNRFLENWTWEAQADRVAAIASSVLEQQTQPRTADGRITSAAPI